jgi:hypothetical protein
MVGQPEFEWMARSVLWPPLWRALLEPRLRRQGAAPESIKLETKAKLREVIQKEAAALKMAPLESGQVRQKVKDIYDNLSPDLKLADPGQAEKQVER